LIASGVRKSAAQEDTYDNGLCSAIQSNEWQWDGTVVGEITEEDVGDKFISTEEACKICEDNPDCYYYSCIGSRFGSGCTLYGDDAVKIDLECDMCTNWNGSWTYLIITLAHLLSQAILPKQLKIHLHLAMEKSSVLLPTKTRSQMELFQ